MMKPMDPVEETTVVQRRVGYSWSYSFEVGPSGSRQKLILTGNTEGMARALTELRKAKISLMELAVASGEELAMPSPFEGYKKDKEDVLY